MAYSSIPPYFSWVVDRLLAISSHPYHHTHLRYLSENGINTVVSINDEIEPPFHTSPNLRVINLSISAGIPTVSQCQHFVSLIENAKERKDGILVHSLKSTGRAAVLLACYLVKAWECPVDYAIDRLRLIRPVSIENFDQENVIKQYHASIQERFEGFIFFPFLVFKYSLIPFFFILNKDIIQEFKQNGTLRQSF